MLTVLLSAAMLLNDVTMTISVPMMKCFTIPRIGQLQRLFGNDEERTEQ
jgi:hypothetical protein